MPFDTKNTVVTLGDSRMGREGNPIVAAPGETAIYTSDRGIFSTANVMLRHRLDLVASGGVGGDTTAQMLNRLDGLLSYKPGWLIGFGHVNSIPLYSALEIIGHLDTIFNRAYQAGVNVVWGTDWVSSSATNAQKLISYTVNNWLRTQVATRANFYLIEYQAVMVDSVTGYPSATDAGDGLHQDPVGAFKLANQLYKVLDKLVPVSDRLIASNDDLVNLIPNGMLSGGTTYATSWGFSGTGSQGVASKVVRTDGYSGDWQQIAVTGGTDYVFRNRIAAGTANSWVPGDTLYAECEFETDAAGWAPTEFNFNIFLYGQAGNTISRATDLIHLNGVPSNTSRITSGIFRTPIITTQSNCTTVDVAVILKGSGTFRIARAALKRA